MKFKSQNVKVKNQKGVSNGTASVKTLFINLKRICEVVDGNNDVPPGIRSQLGSKRSDPVNQLLLPISQSQAAGK